MSKQEQVQQQTSGVFPSAALLSVWPTFAIAAGDPAIIYEVVGYFVLHIVALVALLRSVGAAMRRWIVGGIAVGVTVAVWCWAWDVKGMSSSLVSIIWVGLPLVVMGGVALWEKHQQRV